MDTIQEVDCRRSLQLRCYSTASDQISYRFYVGAAKLIDLLRAESAPLKKTSENQFFARGCFFALQKRKNIFIYFSRITMPPTTAVSSFSIPPELNDESQDWFKDWLEEASKEEIVEFYVKKDKHKSEKIDILQDTINTIKKQETTPHVHEELIIEKKKVLKREKMSAARHQKELNTKNFLIKQLKEERTKLQGENKILTKNLNDEVFELQNIVNAVEDESDKVRKEVKALKAKKFPKQQNNSKKSAPPDKETDVKQLEAANKKLQLEKKELQQALADVLEKHEQIICCRICEEKFDNSEERVPVKLKCSHVFCASCANSWLAAHRQKATCPQCRTIYRAGDIEPVNFNL